MPTYEYECLSCNHTFEVFQSMSDEPLKKCPKCGKKIRRLIGGGVGIIFKGSGFYVTDNKSSGYNGSKKDETAKKEDKAGETAKVKSDGEKKNSAKESSKETSKGSSKENMKSA